MSENDIGVARTDLEKVFSTIGWPPKLDKASIDARKVAVQYFVHSLNKIIAPLRVQVCL